MTINLSTQIAWNCDSEAGFCSLEDFFEENLMDEAERADVFNALIADTIYFGGGGAAPEYTVAVASDFVTE